MSFSTVVKFGPLWRSIFGLILGTSNVNVNEETNCDDTNDARHAQAIGDVPGDKRPEEKASHFHDRRQVSAKKEEVDPCPAAAGKAYENRSEHSNQEARKCIKNFVEASCSVFCSSIETVNQSLEYSDGNTIVQQAGKEDNQLRNGEVS